MSTPETTEPNASEPTPLLGLRPALILLLAVLSGIGAGLLAAWAGRHPGDAILIGAGATVAAAAFFNWAIAHR